MPLQRSKRFRSMAPITGIICDSWNRSEVSPGCHQGGRNRYNPVPNSASRFHSVHSPAISTYGRSDDTDGAKNPVRTGRDGWLSLAFGNVLGPLGHLHVFAAVGDTVLSSP